MWVRMSMEPMVRSFTRMPENSSSTPEVMIGLVGLGVNFLSCLAVVMLWLAG